jgi:colanic acid biosynthesis glycosyl transferase WcaI
VSCWLLAVVKRATHIYSIFDMYPEAIIDAGLLSPGWITRLLMAADTLVCRYSERTMVISEGLRQRLLERGLAAEKTVVLPMWVDVGEMRLLPRVNAWRQEQQIPDSAFVALYAGTVGLVQGAHIIIEAAERLTDDPGVLFVLVAQGLTRPELEQMTRDRGLTNVRFLDYQPRERLAEVQATADVSLVTLLPGQGRNFLPSKVLAYMAASRPIVASVDPESDTALLIEQAQCGSVAPAGDPNALADAIRTLHSDPGRAAALGAQGHTYFLERHSREAATRIYEALFRQVVAERRRKPPAQSGIPEAPPNT